MLFAVQISPNIFIKKSAQKIWKYHYKCNDIEKQRVITSTVFSYIFDNKMFCIILKINILIKLQRSSRPIYAHRKVLVFQGFDFVNPENDNFKKNVYLDSFQIDIF